MGKKPSSHIIHSLGGEYCRIVRGSEPIRLLKSPRSLSVYILSRIMPLLLGHLKKTIYALGDSFYISQYEKNSNHSRKENAEH